MRTARIDRLQSKYMGRLACAAASAEGENMPSRPQSRVACVSDNLKSKKYRASQDGLQHLLVGCRSHPCHSREKLPPPTDFSGELQRDFPTVRRESEDSHD